MYGSCMHTKLGKCRGNVGKTRDECQIELHKDFNISVPKILVMLLTRQDFVALK